MKTALTFVLALLSAVSCVLAAETASCAVKEVDSVPRSYTLLHRFRSGVTWEPRGLLVVNETSHVDYTNLLEASQIEAIRSAAATAAETEAYQLLLLHGSPRDGAAWDLALSRLDGPITYLKACHLRQSSPALPTIDDVLTVRMHVKKPFAISYRVKDIQLERNGCPSQNQKKVKALQDRAKIASRKGATEQKIEQGTFETELIVTQPEQPSIPPLRAPLPTKEDGTIKQPEPEKTFLQKYWYYLIPLAIIALFPGEDEKKEGAESHASSSSSGRGQGAKRVK